ncbi:hypothetical protein IQ06DRAFT_7658 [Phaeosphaeriaceae sp. SRC1lsM3a]|nr:hypothetical protein IQ06DRAFT_7658 [Stagonospora sp. SRC1lsM3a]
MPASTACPISEVDRALSSYINSREDTLRIRRTLSRYLTTSLRPVNAATKNQHLNHECPQNLTATSTNPPGLKDSRLEYLQALRAHDQIRQKHRELQASLEDLQQRHIDENPVQGSSDYYQGNTQIYIDLLRQRRRHAELQVIQDALEKLLIARPSHAPKDPKELVKEVIGEQPDLPAERLEQISPNNDDQTWTYKLKQEVLESRSSMDRAKAARAEAQSKSHPPPSLAQQVHALECARDEIVEWVQGELAKMEEDSVFLEDASPVKRPMNTADPVDLGSIEHRIRKAYDQYTASRAQLLENYESLQSPHVPQPDNASEPAKDKINPHHPTRPSRPMTSILPHLPHLVHIANNDRALLQHTVFLQAQIASADTEIEEALLRLSGESHLLPAGSKDVAAWGKTAAEAETAMEEIVKGYLEKSKEEVGSVSRIVELCSLQSEVLGKR